MPHKKTTLLVDFDGVIHDYKGWNEGKLGEPVPGAEEWLWAMQRLYRVVITSPRFYDGDEVVYREIKDWISSKFGSLMEKIEIFGSGQISPHHLYVSARCLPFTGTFPSTQIVCGFRPYWKSGEKEVEVPEDAYDLVDQKYEKGEL